MPTKINATTGTTIGYKASKLGNHQFLSPNRIGLLFTFNTEFETDIDDFDPYAFSGETRDILANNITGTGFTAQNKGLMLAFNPAAANKPKEILVGAGFKSVRVNQQINVTQEGSLGFFDIAETIEHNVANNELSVEKACLRLQTLGSVGLAPFGKAVLTSPRLNCYIYDAKERQRGVNIGYIKAIGLHIANNSFNASLGQTVMESVTFKVDRFQNAVNPPQELLKLAKKVFPHLYSNVETLAEFTYDQG